MEIVDRRIRRTQKSLHEALISLVLEKNYDSITVQEILDRADVGRSTFYAHFDGKDKLLLSGTHELRNTLNAALQRERSSAKTHEVITSAGLCLSVRMSTGRFTTLFYTHRLGRRFDSAYRKF